MTPRTTEARLKVIADLMLLGPVTKGNPDDVIDMCLKAMSEFDDADVEAGELLLLRGHVPSYQGAYRPGPPQVAQACRMAQGERLEHERIIDPPGSSPLLVPVEKTLESKERVRRFLVTGDASVFAILGRN